MHLQTWTRVQAYTMVHHVVYEHTTLLFNRHLDQLLLGALYGTCKVRDARCWPAAACAWPPGRPPAAKASAGCMHAQAQLDSDT